MVGLVCHSHKDYLVTLFLQIKREIVCRVETRTVAFCAVCLEEGWRTSERVLACVRLWDAVCKVMMWHVSGGGMGERASYELTPTLSLLRVVRFELKWGGGKMSSQIESWVEGKLAWCQRGHQRRTWIVFDNAASCQEHTSQEMGREPMAAGNESSVQPVGVVTTVNSLLTKLVDLMEVIGIKVITDEQIA